MDLGAGPVTLLSSDVESGLLKQSVVMAQPAPPEDVSNDNVVCCGIGELALHLEEVEVHAAVDANCLVGLLGC